MGAPAIRSDLGPFDRAARDPHITMVQPGSFAAADERAWSAEFIRAVFGALKDGVLHMKAKRLARLVDRAMEMRCHDFH